MSNSTSHSLPYPIRKARFSITALFSASGTPTDPSSADTEYSTDGGATFSDTAEEITTGGANGAGYLTLTGAETDNPLLVVAFKSSNCTTSAAVLYPRNLPIVSSGTLSAGSAGGGTLGTVIAYDVTNCFIRTTGGTGGGGTGGANNQARRIITYTTSTGAFTVSPNWETTPSTDTTYDVLLPEGVTLGVLKALNPTTPGRTLDVSSGGEAGLDWANVGSPTTTLALTGTTIATTQQVDLNTIKTQTVTCSAGVTVSPFVGSTGAAINGTSINTLSGHDPGGTLASATNQFTDAQIATAVLTTQMVESYAANGVAPTLTQAVMLIQQCLMDFDITFTTKTIRKIDGTTTAATETLNSSTAPTAITRAT